MCHIINEILGVFFLSKGPKNVFPSAALSGLKLVCMFSQHHHDADESDENRKFCFSLSLNACSLVLSSLQLK